MSASGVSPLSPVKLTPDLGHDGAWCCGMPGASWRLPPRLVDTGIVPKKRALWVFSKESQRWWVWTHFELCLGALSGGCVASTLDGDTEAGDWKEWLQCGWPEQGLVSSERSAGAKRFTGGG